MVLIDFMCGFCDVRRKSLRGKRRTAAAVQAAHAMSWLGICKVALNWPLQHQLRRPSRLLYGEINVT